MKKLITEQNIKKERLSRFFLTVLILLVVALSVTRVVIANHLVEASERLRILDKSITETQATNQTLAEALRKPQSITLIENKATAMGFVPTSHLVFLTTTPEVALETSLTRILR